MKWTPLDEMVLPRLAFFIGSNAFVRTKAKSYRYLIDDECNESNHTATKTKKGESVKSNVVKIHKATPDFKQETSLWTKQFECPRTLETENYQLLVTFRFFQI